MNKRLQLFGALFQNVPDDAVITVEIDGMRLPVAKRRFPGFVEGYERKEMKVCPVTSKGVAFIAVPRRTADVSKMPSEPKATAILTAQGDWRIILFTLRTPCTLHEAEELAKDVRAANPSDFVPLPNTAW